jgi:hypothetical protein
VNATVLADLSGADVVLVLVTAVSVVAVAAICFAVVRVTTVLQRATRILDTLEAEALPLIDELARSVADANEELARVERLVGSAESISATVDATSKLAYRALSAPVIKTVAMTSGASRAARRLRRE